MRVQHRVVIGGIEYTDKLKSVSAYDVGVRSGDFIGYVSDITCTLAYDRNLLDVLEQDTSVYYMLDNFILRVDGKVRRVEARGGTVDVVIAHEWVLDPSQNAKTFSGSADQVIEWVLSQNGYLSKKRNLHSWAVQLNINNSQKQYETLLREAAEQGLYLVVPARGGYIDIVGAEEGSPVYTITEAHILPKSVRVFLTTWQVIDVLEVKWNNGTNTTVYGSGLRKEIYYADHIVDQTSADNFGNNYLAYHGRKKEVQFSTPLSPDLISLEVGDIITLNYGTYSLTMIGQILQKKVKDATIDWAVREL